VAATKNDAEGARLARTHHQPGQGDSRASGLVQRRQRIAIRCRLLRTLKQYMSRTAHGRTETQAVRIAMSAAAALQPLVAST
jgi:hypothetical protein